MSVLHVSEKVIPELYNHGIKADAIVVDLPSKGCDEELLRTIASMMPKKIVYASCDPGTQFCQLDYTLDMHYGNISRVYL